MPAIDIDRNTAHEAAQLRRGQAGATAGAEILQIGRFRHSAGRGDDLVAKLCQHGRGDRTDAAGSARDDHGASLRRQPVLFQRQHREHGGETGGADRHRVAGGETVRQTHQPVALHPRLFCICSKMGLAHAPAGADHLVAGLPCRVRGLLDRAGEIDACNHWETSHHRRLSGDGKTVLVVQRRPLHGNCDVAVHQLGFVKLRERGCGAFVGLVDTDCLERGHERTP